MIHIMHKKDPMGYWNITVRLLKTLKSRKNEYNAKITINNQQQTRKNRSFKTYKLDLKEAIKRGMITRAVRRSSTHNP